MGKNAFKLLTIEYARDARCNGYNAVFRISSCREGIGAFIIDNVDLRHRNRSFLGERGNSRVELRSFAFRDRLRPVHPEDYLVAKPVAHKIHHKGYHKEPSTDKASQSDENNRKNNHEKKRFCLIHTNLDTSNLYIL